MIKKITRTASIGDWDEYLVEWEGGNEKHSGVVKITNAFKLCCGGEHEYQNELAHQIRMLVGD